LVIKNVLNNKKCFNKMSKRTIEAIESDEFTPNKKVKQCIATNRPKRTCTYNNQPSTVKNSSSSYSPSSSTSSSSSSPSTKSTSLSSSVEASSVEILTDSMSSLSLDTETDEMDNSESEYHPNLLNTLQNDLTPLDNSQLHKELKVICDNIESKQITLTKILQANLPIEEKEKAVTLYNILLHTTPTSLEYLQLQEMLTDMITTETVTLNKIMSAEIMTAT
jgi:hypothetical protein